MYIVLKESYVFFYYFIILVFGFILVIVYLRLENYILVKWIVNLGFLSCFCECFFFELVKISGSEKIKFLIYFFLLYIYLDRYICIYIFMKIV